MDYIAIFGSSYKALKAEKLLKGKGVPFRLIPAPRGLALYCDLAITFKKEVIGDVEKALKDGGIKVAAYYAREGERYVEV